MTNVDPPDSVPVGQETRFRGLYGKCIHNKLQKFPEQSKREDLREEIDIQQAHRKLISYSIFPFSQGSPGGYKFVTAEPLEELEVPNFDFLLWNLDGSVILGEAKSSIPSNATTVVNQLNKRKEVAEVYKEYLERRYLGSEINHMEFVLVTYVQHGDKIAREIIEEGEEFITWVVDAHSDTLLIRQARPQSFPDNLESEDPDEMLSELDRRHTHDVRRLNGELDRVGTSFGQADVLPTSIIVDQLRVIVQSRRVEDRHPCIDHRDIVEYVSNSSFNYSDGKIDSIVTDLVEAGKRINFLCEWDDNRADYKIVSNYTARDDLEVVLENKWVEWRIENMKDALREDCKEKAISEIDQQQDLAAYGGGVIKENVESNETDK
ncbi:hypothetical protein C483_02880 [Natrialba hulunbeirensis JCM 10989]|uniref:Uncharacterized protein n=1 Tax=Natrialba hulunbeirensis JCM 10989 TaxID=1227493 RepID=M0A8E8_9EURY|nr:hypothetical protein [Natrialba hulunbeirensis]ELY94641.1 hypothetical protein C483_02880 [Natrialba hulunbeirensis JCM 10989]